MFTNIWAFVTAWYNVPCTVLLGACAIFAALQLIGLGGDQETDPELVGEANFDQDLGADQDLDGETDSEADPENQADSDSPASTLSLLAFLGIGKAPLLVVLLILFGTLGILGWCANAAVIGLFGNYPAVMLALTGPIALIGAGGLTSQAARLIGRALPPLSTTASNAQALVGRVGTVISPFVDQNYGQIHLRDSGGTLISVFAVSDAAEPIKRGECIVLVSYQSGRKCYVVTRSKMAA